MNSRMYGIDVSDNQGYINWPEVKAAGVQFAILRSVRRSGNPDKQLASNIKGCLECGMPFDFYKYSYALTPAEAREEVKQVVECTVFRHRALAHDIAHQHKGVDGGVALRGGIGIGALEHTTELIGRIIA